MPDWSPPTASGPVKVGLFMSRFHRKNSQPERFAPGFQPTFHGETGGAVLCEACEARRGGRETRQERGEAGARRGRSEMRQERSRRGRNEACQATRV